MTDWVDITGYACGVSTSKPYDLWQTQSTYVGYACDPAGPDSDGYTPPDGLPPTGSGPVWYSTLTSYWDIPASGGNQYNFLIYWVGPDYPTATKMRLRYHNPTGLDGSEWAVLCRATGGDTIDTVPLASQLVGTPIDANTTEFVLDLPAGEGLLGPGSAPGGFTLAPIIGPNPKGGMFAIAIDAGSGSTAFWTDYVGCRENF